MSDWTLEQIESDFADLHGYVYETEIIEERRDAFKQAIVEAKAQAFEAAAVRVRANFAEHGERCPWVGFLDDEAERIRKGWS